LVAVLDRSAARWNALDWEVLRESGVSAAVVDTLVETSFPLILRSELAWGDRQQAGKFWVDTQYGFSHYPQWSREESRPWGPYLEGPDAPHLVLAALSAGAPVVFMPCPLPQSLGEVAVDLRSLAGLLGRELTRIPKAAAPIDRVPSANESSFGGSDSYQVAFQGEPGAFSEMAVHTLFSKSSTTAIPLPAFLDVFSAVLAGEVDYGMVPIENSLAGPINENYDLLLQFPDLRIVAETQVRVEHNLIGLPGTKLGQIKRVFSHPQGLAQSRQFLESHPDWEAVPFYDTAGSVKHIAKVGDPSLAAIASGEAARVYRMEVLVPGVETNPRNFTRFFLIGRQMEIRGGVPNKASLVFGTADAPGALSRCLAVFAAHDVNMTKLESRPIHGRPWDYMFYVDVRLPAEHAAFDRTLQELGSVAQELRVLGVYRAEPV